MTAYLTEERQMMQEMARTFAREEVLPVANKLDPVQGDIPDDLIEKMGELGFFGIMIPEDKGGLGLGCFEYCLVAEELSAAWMSVGSLIARGNSFYKSVPGKDEAQRAERIEMMAQGKYLGALAMSEPNAGSDVASLATRAEKDGDSWVITGNKYWCTFADRADFIQIMCRTPVPEGSPRHAGISAIPMEKERGSFPEGCSGSPIPKIGYFGWKTYEMAFDNCRVPAYERDVKGQGGGFLSIAKGLEVARAHTGARSIGLAQLAYEIALQYAQEREQFGQPIGNFQAIRFKLATMATEIQAARQLLYYVCDQIDTGRRCDTEASMIKYYAAEMAERVTSEALQIMGGAGYTTHYPVERCWRDARLTKIFEGSSEIQQRIISDNLLGKPVKPKF